MKVFINTAQLFKLSLLAIVFLCSCNKSENKALDSLSAAERTKVERILKLASDNGWQIDSMMTEEQLVQEILKMDEQEFTTLVNHINSLNSTEPD